MDGVEIALRLVVLLKGLNELLLLTLLGQGALWLLAGTRREDNLIYGAFSRVGRPLFRLCRRVLPRFVPDRWMPVFAFVFLLLFELLLIIAKVVLFAQMAAV
ncbi:hypothetical protein [Methyloversatilis universalis]|uniref:hypothetical protein n=1 Tax=Methyloversatilis universalis TaxID=378211 RepID=UPI0003665E8B|nr:hypothetical protein [Methyloversatilis universalis]